MEKEILETVLLELLEETKKTNVLMEEQVKEIQELKTAFSDFNRKLTEIKVIAPEPDILPLTRIVTEGVKRLHKIVAAQPKDVLHEKGFCFSRNGIKKNITRSSSVEFYSGYFG